MPRTIASKISESNRTSTSEYVIYDAENRIPYKAVKNEEVPISCACGDENYLVSCLLVQKAAVRCISYFRLATRRDGILPPENFE